MCRSDRFFIKRPFLCSKCGPRLSEQAAEKLRNRYVMMRGGARQHERDTAKKISIPITVRSAITLSSQASGWLVAA